MKEVGGERASERDDLSGNTERGGQMTLVFHHVLVPYVFFASSVRRMKRENCNDEQAKKNPRR